MKVGEAWDQIIPLILVGKEGGIVKENFKEEKPWRNHLGGQKEFYSSIRVYFKSQTHGLSSEV